MPGRFLTKYFHGFSASETTPSRASLGVRAKARKGWCDMNKKIIKMAITALACVTICGTMLAAPAPRGGKGPAPAHQKAPAPKPGKAHGHEVARHGAPAHHPAPVRHPAPPPPPPPPPPPRVVHVEHHHEANGWAVLGAAVIGGIVGAIAH